MGEARDRILHTRDPPPEHAPMTSSPAVPSPDPAADYARYRDLFRGRNLPLAFVDLDRLDANLSAIAARAGSKRLRLASKSVRCRAVIERALASSPVYRGVMCYSGWEAAHLADHGIDDLLVAYPIVGRAQVEAVCARVAGGRSITLMIDCAEHVELLAPIAEAAGVRLLVCLDLDMSSDFALLGLHFGVRRSPVASVAALGPVLDALDRRPSLKLEGIMGYEAQIAGVPDAAPGGGFKNLVVRRLKRSSIAEIRERRATVVEAVRARGHELRFVNGGGTGSLEWTREEACVTEVTAGSGFYCSTLFDGYSNFHHLPAAGFALEITRRPLPDVFTCHGGGYVASGPPGPDRVPRPWLPEEAALLPLEMAGEVQTPVRYEGPERLGIGEPIFFRHAKAGELCEHFDSLLLVRGDRVEGEAPTYRGEGKCFLG